MLYEKARQFWRMCMSDTDTRIVLVTNEFAVVTKRIGEVCESGCEHSVVDAVKPLLEKKLEMTLPFLEAVHRIDRPVSGCVLWPVTRIPRRTLHNNLLTGLSRSATTRSWRSVISHG